MNWEAIGSIGEVVGAVAVIATLIYLSRQIRQHTSALRSTATQAAHDQAGSVYHLLCSDPEMAGIFRRGTSAPDELTADELARLNAFHSLTQFYLQNWYWQTRARLMDDALLSSWSAITAGVSATPGFKQFWAQRRHVYSPEYREWLETEVFPRAVGETYNPLGVRK
jgi:hypothetical protein